MTIRVKCSLLFDCRGCSGINHVTTLKRRQKLPLEELSPLFCLFVDLFDLFFFLLYLHMFHEPRILAVLTLSFQFTILEWVRRHVRSIRFLLHSVEYLLERGAVLCRITPAKKLLCSCTPGVRLNQDHLRRSFTRTVYTLSILCAEFRFFIKLIIDDGIVVV